MRETRLKSTAPSELRSPVATRDGFVKQRPMLLNKVHAMFVRRGTRLEKEGLARRKRLRDPDVSRFAALDRVALNALRNQAPALTEPLAPLDKALEAAGAQRPGHEGVSSIKGTGSRSATAYGMSRGDAARIGGMDRQTPGDRGLRSKPMVRRGCRIGSEEARDPAPALRNRMSRRFLSRPILILKRTV